MFLEKIIVKLPFLLLPLAFTAPESMSVKKFESLLHVLIFCVFSAGVVSFVNYLLHFQEINALIIDSKPIPILFNKINHIYYAILLAFAAHAGIYLLGFGMVKSTIIKILLWIETIGILIFLHSISARTGVFAFYAAAMAGFAWLIITRKKYLLGAGLAFAGVLTIFLAIKFIPSVKNRVENTRTDLEILREGVDLNDYSIAMRFEAILTALKVFKKNMSLGVGEGDLEDDMHVQYIVQNSNLTYENQKLPHNQFLQTLCTTGIPGFLLLISVFLLPFFRGIGFRHYLFFSFLVISFFACQAESILERQVGITFVLVFYLLIPSVYKNEDLGTDILPLKKDISPL